MICWMKQKRMMQAHLLTSRAGRAIRIRQHLLHRWEAALIPSRLLVIRIRWILLRTRSGVSRISNFLRRNIMANKILTPQIIANEALMVLQSNLTMANLVHRDYSGEFVKVGDTITVRKPATFVAKNFTGQTEAQDITEGSVTVKMDRFRDITVNVGSKEMTLDIKNFSEQVITPAMQAMAQQIDADLLAVGISKAGKKATVSKTPAITDIAGVGKALDQAKAPRTDRRLVLPPTILYQYNTLDNFAKQCYKGDSIALKESEIGKVYTCETFMSQNCPENQNDKAGTATSYKVAGTKDATQFTVSSGKAETATINKGDQLIVNGYLYTVTDNVTLSGGAGTVKVDQNIPETVAETDAFVVSKAHALGFHRNGLALVTRNLELPMGNKNAYIASADGLGVRVVFDYDSDHKQDKISFDIIYGIKELNENLLVDFS
nr:MAG TPA: coat protein [Caudoviricetes sp.]